MTISVSSGLRAKSRGFTLTELAIVLSIMGLILGSIWTAASKVYFNQKITKASTQILSLAEGVKGSFPNGTITTTGWFTGFLVDSGATTSDMVVPLPCTGLTYGVTTPTYAGNGGCLASPWGQIIVGSQEYNAAFAGAEGPNSFEILIATPTMTPAQCVAFLASMISAAQNGGLFYINYYNAGGQTSHAISATTSPSIASDCTGGNVMGLQFTM